MKRQWMLLLTLFVCAVLYPAVVWLVGQTVFSGTAQGSLVGSDGQPVRDEKNAVGSQLIGQPFLDEDGNVLEEYFQPRLSAASYNGAASGATNWGADSPALRDRVIGMLGPLLKYRDGRPIGPDIVAWVRENSLDAGAMDDRGIQAAFFADWWRAHPEAEFMPVPADMVTASGSGLDPHITWKNALYQLDRVADAWAKKTKAPRERVLVAIRELLDEKKETPLSGLAGVELVNVLEVNLALPGRVQRLAPAR